MLLSEAIPIQELTVELCLAGRFDDVLRGTVHCKTCPYTILAQAEQGRYGISCGNGQDAELCQGEAFLTGANLPLRIVHHGDADDGFKMRIRWIHFHFTLFKSIDVTSLLELPLRVSRQQCEPFGEIIQELLLLQKESQNSRIWLSHMARRSELAFGVLRLLSELAPLRPDALELLGQRKRLGPVLEFMRIQLGARIKVEDLARQANLSVPRFYAFFRQFMGCSPMEHLKHLRLSEACRLMATGNAPLRVVAEETGFCNEFHLSREFRSVFGKPPGVWRREYNVNLA